jgi:hypothetical protein
VPIKKIIILLILIVLITSFALIIFRVNTFIPSIQYKVFSYLYSLISIVFLVYAIFIDNPNLNEDKKRKNIIVVPMAFFVLYFLSLSGMFYGISGVLQYLPSQDRTLTKKVILKYENTGRASNVHGFKVEDSYFYGNTRTDKKTLTSIDIGDKVIFYGKENLFGFYSNKFEVEKNGVY